MQSGKISSWKVKQGDTFAAGDVLLTVETDKGEAFWTALMATVADAVMQMQLKLTWKLKMMALLAKSS